jgi:predicted nucleic acid-binding protein
VRFLDTNVILRYLTRDDEAKAAACLRLLKRAGDGIEELTSSEAVFTETVYVLESARHYRLPRGEIRGRLVPVLMLRGLRMANRTALLRALDVYVEYPDLDVEDALAVAHMERHGVTEIVSYDTGFDRVPGIERQEP